jgi:hypothetical protein
MAISLPRTLVEHILLGPAGDRRQLQDSPILADVWIAFANEPANPQDLLITPYSSQESTQSAAEVAVELDDLIHQYRAKQDGGGESPDIAHLQGIVAARLYFKELLAVVVPRTGWWEKNLKKEMKDYLNDDTAAGKRLDQTLKKVAKLLDIWGESRNARNADTFLSVSDRYTALAGIILWAAKPDLRVAAEDKQIIADAIKQGIERGEIAGSLNDLLHDIRKVPHNHKQKSWPLVYQVSLNRQAFMAIARSVPAVKGDAARSLFNVNCSAIGWAVIDSGIQGDRDCFLDAKGQSRVKRSFDFSNYRKIVSLDNRRPDARKKLIAAVKAAKLTLKTTLSEDDLEKNLASLADDLRLKRPVHWDLVEPFLEIATETQPAGNHGTHVAGIIGASKSAENAGAKKKKTEDSKEEAAGTDAADGMCPDIQLYDFRIIAPDSEKNTEFAIIAALQYIRYLNARNDFITIHGANLSLAIKHDVHNYACGWTPICVECERLVDSGVCVVAAAGNFGYQTFTTKEGAYESYAAFSITDPGNADGVITVGATHRYSPHTYGVSFFSSRGPTGDGRMKPDLVAPGERIRAPFPDKGAWGDLDGTSMAAPHVSGASAMLMARYSELIAQPRRIKRILCETATDLGRERSFQGHGMLDVLRAFQHI